MTNSNPYNLPQLTREQQRENAAGADRFFNNALNFILGLPAGYQDPAPTPPAAESKPTTAEEIPTSPQTGKEGGMTGVDMSIQPVVVPQDTAQNTTTATSDSMQGNRSALLDILQAITNKEYLEDVSRTRADAQIAIDDAAAANALLKTQEKTRREESVARINAWKEVERSTIQANALMASSLATTAYIAGTPNANVLSALAGPQQQAMQAFQSQSQSVIPAQAVTLNYGSAPQPIRLG